MLLAVFPVVFIAETLTGGSTSHYRTRGFVNDLCYYFILGYSGLLDLMGAAPAYLAGVIFYRKFPFLVLHLNGWPLACRYILWWVVIDFIGYWSHRMFHEIPLLWPLHATHHCQEVLTFPGANRVHPIQNVTDYCLKLFPLMMLGAQPQIGFLLTFVLRTIPDAFQHSEVSWRIGPFYRVFVSPAFHSFHHSPEVRYHDRNYGLSFSFWDFLFGTGIDEPVRNHVYGVHGIHWGGPVSQLLKPFPMMIEVWRAMSWRCLCPVSVRLAVAPKGDRTGRVDLNPEPRLSLPEG